MRVRPAPHALALVLYALTAIVFTWPLAAHLSTHLPGDPAGDTGIYVWNLWAFARGWPTAAGPFLTDAIFAATGVVDLALHNYTVASNLLGLPFAGRIGIIAAFNVVLLAQMVLTAYGTFVLARYVTHDARAAWLAGLAFAFSPVLTAKSMGHYSLVAAAPLPLFVWTLLRAIESRRWAGWALASGACLAWAGYSDVYYAIYCLVLLVLVCAHRALRLAPDPIAGPSRALWLVGTLAGLTGVTIIATGGGSLEIAGHLVHARTPFTAMAIATGCAVVEIGRRWLPRIRVSPGFTIQRALAIVALCACSSALLLSPLLQMMVQRWLDGDWMEVRIFWRSSPAGIDLAALLLPNPTHALWGDLLQPLLWAWRPDAFPEHVGSLSLVALLLVALVRIRTGRWSPGTGLWLTITASAVLLAVGPFLTVAGVTTGIPGPWSLLRYVPVLGWARAPSRFAVLATLGLCLLFAFALREIMARRGGLRLVALVAVALALELSPAPRHLFAAAAPSIYGIVAADPDPRVRVLELPTGARDGLTSLGNFRTRAQFAQVTHGKAILGGYLSRASGLRRRRMMEVPTMRALVHLSAGGTLAPGEDAQARLLARQFIQRARVGYVIFVTDRVSPALRAWAIEALDLRPVAAGEGRELYRPSAWPPDVLGPIRDLRPEARPPSGSAGPRVGEPGARRTH